MSKATQTTVQHVGQELTNVTPRAEDDLPMHVKGGAVWTVYKDPKYNMYTILDVDGKEVPVELINNRWYALDSKKGNPYRTCEDWEITDLAKTGLGYWLEHEWQHPAFKRKEETDLFSPRMEKKESDESAKIREREEPEEILPITPEKKGEEVQENLSKDYHVLSRTLEKLVRTSSKDIGSPVPPAGYFPKREEIAAQASLEYIMSQDKPTRISAAAIAPRSRSATPFRLPGVPVKGVRSHLASTITYTATGSQLHQPQPSQAATWKGKERANTPFSRPPSP